MLLCLSFIMYLAVYFLILQPLYVHEMYDREFCMNDIHIHTLNLHRIVKGHLLDS